MHTTGKQPNLKKNIVMGVINAIVNTIVPALSFLYVARRLSVEGFGINQFAASLVGYFTLFAALGIPLYANKKLAQAKDNPDQFKKQASELFVFSLITSTLAFIVYLIFISSSATTLANITIYLIYGFNLFGNTFTVEWFFQATERFTYIAIRNIIIKLLTFTAYLLFIKGPEDYLLYAIIAMISLFVYASINFSRFCKLAKPSFKNINIKQHIKPVIYVFILNLTFSLYLYLDNIMLGFLRQGDFQYAVAQFSVAAKIPRSVIGVICAINGVLLPRLAYTIKQNNQEGVKNILSKSLTILIAWSLPACVGVALLAPKIIPLLCGVEYVNAIATTQVLALSIALIPLINLMGLQIFYNIGKSWKTITASVIGIAVHITLNFLLIPTHSFLGAGMANVSGIIVTFIFQIILGYKHLTFKKFTWDNLAAVLSTCLMFASVWLLIDVLAFSRIINLSILLLVGVASYGLGLILFQHKYFITQLKAIYNKIFGKR